MRRIAYFGTDGCPGHYFKAISGGFSSQEEEELSKIDEEKKKWKEQYDSNRNNISDSLCDSDDTCSL